jgi:hypothetical protein
MNVNVMTHDELDAVALSNDERQGEFMLAAVYKFLGRFVSFPSEHAQVAHTLWCVHTHLMDRWESTPRLALLSPEPASGKTRALEVTELLVPNPVSAVNVSPAYLFRKVGSDEAVTILFDEIDTVFGPKAKENEEIRGLLNAGHRRGAVAGRCVVHGKTVMTEEIPAYAAVALAGLGWLPETIMSRSIIIRMRRRHAGERVEQYRRRIHAPQGEAVRAKIEAWARSLTDDIPWPELPPDWPIRAREAAVALVAEAKERDPTLGVRLLADLKSIFGDAKEMTTEAILRALHALNESPWNDLKGKPLNDRGLAQRLRQYEIRPQVLTAGSHRGYRRADLVDAWDRYLAPPPSSDGSVTSVTSVTSQPFQQPISINVTDVTDVTLVAANESDPDPDGWSFNTEPEDDLSIPECLRR